MQNHACEDGHQCSHQHIQGDVESLISQIDLKNVIGYNLVDPSKVKNIFRGLKNMDNNFKEYIESDADEEVLLYIP